MTKKKKITLIAVISLSVLCVGCLASISVDNWIRNRLPNAEQIKLTDEPDNIAWRFNQALMQDNIGLAKELVTAENRERIEKWQRDTERGNYDCKFDWVWFFKYPLEIQRISWGSVSYSKMDDNEAKGDSVIGCYSNNYSMKIDKVIIEKIGNEWVITDWDKICEKSPSARSDRPAEICYP
jgi:hypothetical protein